MRNYIAIILMVINLLSLAGNNPVEQAKADFKRINNVYSATPVFSLDIQYCVFDNHAGGNLVEQKFGQYFKSNSLSYTKILNIETIVNAKTTIIVNNDERILVIADTKPIQLSPIQTNVDTLLKMCSSIKIKDIGKTERNYILDFSDNENSEFDKIELFIDLSNYHIKKLVMYYSQGLPLNQNDFYAEEKKPRLEITYKTFKALPAINESLFTEYTYVSLIENKYKGKGKYSKYKIINQLQSVRFKKK